MNLLANQGLEKFPVFDAANRRIELVELAVPKDSSARPYSSAARPCTLSWPYAYGKASMASCTAPSVGSRSARMPQGTRARSNLLEGHIRPARTQQRLIGQRAFQPYPLQRHFRSLELTLFEQHGPEHQVRFVANRVRNIVVSVNLTGFVELQTAFPIMPIVEQRNAEVERGKTFEAVGALQPPEYLGSIGWAANGKVNIGREKLNVVTDLRGHAPLDPAQGFERISHLSLLEVNACQPECGFVAHSLVHVTFQYRFDCATRTVVHPIVELEVANEKFSLLDVMEQRIQLRFVQAIMLAEFGIQAFQGLEVISLIGVVDGFAEVEITKITRSSWGVVAMGNSGG